MPNTTADFALALAFYMNAHDEAKHGAWYDSDAKREAGEREAQALVRLEDAFNDAVDERVQQALAYDRHDLRESER